MPENSTRPTVSVIVPNFNHSQFLQKRIDSILYQTYHDFELIILDDCSTDDSKEVIENYRSNSKVTEIIYNHQNSGSTFMQWEKGIKLARGKYIWMAESDDYADATLLSRLTDIVLSDNDIGIAFCSSNFVDANGVIGEDYSLYEKSFIKKGCDEVRNCLCRVNSIQNASAALIKRELAERFVTGIGNYKACGDWIFYTRILQYSDLGYTKEKLNFFRTHHNNTSTLANKNGTWVTEGVDVLQNINFYKIHFTRKEILSLVKFWFQKIRSTSLKKKFLLYKKIFVFLGRYVRGGYPGV